MLCYNKIGDDNMGRSSMQGTPWHVVNQWELKTKDEFAWEEKISNSKNQKIKKKQNKKHNTNLHQSNAPKQKTKFHGTFTLRFEDGEEQSFEVGNNISNEAEIVKKVFYSNVGETIDVNEEKILLVHKNMR